MSAGKDAHPSSGAWLIPWRAFVVFLGISVGTTTVVAIFSASMGWSVHSPAWAALAPLAMWAPALGRFVAQRFDRGFASPITLRRWGTTGAQALVWPLAVPLVIYGAASSPTERQLPTAMAR